MMSHPHARAPREADGREGQDERLFPPLHAVGAGVAPPEFRRQREARDRHRHDHAEPDDETRAIAHVPEGVDDHRGGDQAQDLSHRGLMEHEAHLLGADMGVQGAGRGPWDDGRQAPAGRRRGAIDHRCKMALRAWRGEG
jgi:hypothetical protein